MLVTTSPVLAENTQGSIGAETAQAISKCGRSERPIYCWQGLLKKVKDVGEQFVIEGLLNETLDGQIKDKLINFMDNGDFSSDYSTEMLEGHLQTSLIRPNSTSITYTVSNSRIQVTEVKGFPTISRSINTAAFFSWYLQHLYDFKGIVSNPASQKTFLTVGIWGTYDTFSKKTMKDKEYIDTLISEYSREVKNGYYMTNFGSGDLKFYKVELK